MTLNSCPEGRGWIMHKPIIHPVPPILLHSTIRTNSTILKCTLISYFVLQFLECSYYLQIIPDSQRYLSFLVHRDTYHSWFTEGPIIPNSQRDLSFLIHRGAYYSWFTEVPIIPGSQRYLSFLVHRGTYHS